jgi:DNA repair protein RadC
MTGMTTSDPSGHRRRLREKFVSSGLKGFADYEIIELLLSLGTPRRDCKAAAKECIRRFKTLRGVLEAPVEELQKIEGIGRHNSFGIRLVQEVAREFLKEKIIEQPVFESAQAVFDYLYHSMRDSKRELFKVLYLSSQNRIVATDDLAEGTVTGASIAPREVIAGAIRNNAAALILVHNHPSGNPEPSKSDREVTRDLVYSALTMQMKVLDHIIIGDNAFFSFAGDGLIDQYGLDFLGLKMKGASDARRQVYRVSPPGGQLPWDERPAPPAGPA